MGRMRTDSAVIRIEKTRNYMDYFVVHYGNLRVADIDYGQPVAGFNAKPLSVEDPRIVFLLAFRELPSATTVEILVAMERFALVRNIRKRLKGTT